MTNIHFLRSRAGAMLLGMVMVWFAFVQISRADTDPKWYAVEASAAVQVNPPQVALSWPADVNATGYVVSRKMVGDEAWGPGTSLAGSATSFVDANVSSGAAYEYQISKTTSVGYAGYGYVCAGINAPLIEQRGKLILIVDNLYAADLSAELARLQSDLVGDGWVVLRHDVSRNDSPANIKNIIQSDYVGDPVNVQAVFLFGHVPVPYSGNLNPDGHPNHQGAWPADVYYGDMDGSWTDSSVSNTSAERQANWNVPGDGKFDQSDLPSDVELEVGRVDLSNMTCFSNKTPPRYELDLLRQYLNKDHNFRHGRLAIQRRGLICDNFGEKSGEAFAASGWRNFAAFFGADNVVAVPGWSFFSTLSSQSYLWSYGCGGGSYYTCDGLGSSDDFATTDVQTVFTMLLGSYFGDWDNESNFLRAPLGSTSSALAVAWAGRPHWFFHHMGIGETIGYSARISQNNKSGGLYSAQNYGTYGVHVALLGDPSLRLHPVVPPSSPNGAVANGNLTLTWTASTDTDLQGYHVYRANTPGGPYLRITGSTPVTDTTFTDSTAGASAYTYMIRAIKLEHSASGTYFNPSQGIFWNANGTAQPDDATGGLPTVPAAPAALSASAATATQVSLAWSSTGTNQTGFVIQRKSGITGQYAQIATVNSSGSAYSDADLAAGTLYVYRVAAFNAAGDSAFSNEASATTASVPAVPAAAAYIARDPATQGNWSGLYGKDGFNVIGNTASYPSYAFVNSTGATAWTWTPSTSDGRALQQWLSTDHIAACWNAPTAFALDVDLRDGQPHRVALYFLDWDSAGRSESVTLTDANSGAVLDSEAISQFAGGTYLVWNLAGHVQIQISRTAGPNAVVSGLFFDPPAAGPSTVATPSISPDGGAFSGPASVSLSTATAGAVIHYTLDGTEPSLDSPLYATPLIVSGSVTVKAKAFESGMTESATATAAFSSTALLSGQAQALFVRTDPNTQGNWKGAYGVDGHLVVGDSAPASYPAYAQVSPGTPGQYLWSDSTPDVRALQKANASDRVAGCWFQDSSFTVQINLADNRTHRLAAYFVDWDQNGRSQQVDVLDAASGALVDSQTLTDFGSGKYLIWDLKGNILLRFTKVTGNNALLMGLFFDSAAEELSNPSAGTLSIPSPKVIANSGFQLHVTGQAGQLFLIQASTDLVNWTSLAQVTSTNNGLDWADPNSTSFSTRFYRAIPAVADFIAPAD
jgi:hypothetical protein